MAVVTISRQYGSRELDFSNRIAETLGYLLFDRNLVLRAAEELQVSPRFIEEADERADPTGVRRLFVNLVRLSPARSLLVYPMTGAVGPREPTARAIKQSVHWVVRELARQGDVIIVGRGAGLMLKDHPGLLRLRLVAPLESRIRRIAGFLGSGEDEARKAIERVDGQRARYIRQEFNTNWADPANYDLVLNLEQLELDMAVELAVQAVRIVDPVGMRKGT